MLLPGVDRHHLLPVGIHLMQAVVAAEVHQIEDVFLEAAAAKAGADGAGHLLHIGAGGFSEGRNAVDRADALVADSAGLRSQPPVGGTCRDCWGRGSHDVAEPASASRTAALPALGPQPLCSSSQAVRSVGPLKSSNASARDSSCSSGSAWISAVVASLRGPQRRLS